MLTAQEARSYWGELTDKELETFYKEDQKNPLSTFSNLTFEEWLIATTLDTQYCNANDC